MTREQIYDAIWKLADRCITVHNPCQFTDGKCFAGRVNGCCTSGRTKSKRNPAKTVCDHLDEYKGCTIQALGCKLHLCSSPLNFWYAEEPRTSMSKRNGEILDETFYYLLALRDVARELGIVTDCWLTKEETLKESKG